MKPIFSMILGLGLGLSVITLFYLFPVNEKSKEHTESLVFIDPSSSPSSDLGTCMWIGEHWVECGPMPGERECRQNLHTLPKDYWNRKELCIQ